MPIESASFTDSVFALQFQEVIVPSARTRPMREAHAFVDNLMLTCMDSQVYGGWELDQFAYVWGENENVVFQLLLGEDLSVRARHEAAGGEGAPRSSLQVALDRIENPQQVMEGR